MKFGVYLLGLFLFFTSVSVFSNSHSKPYCPNAHFWRTSPGGSLENLVETDSSKELNFDNLKLLVWNVYKGQKLGVYTDLDISTQGIDLALLQEGHLSKTFLNLVCSRHDMNWKMARNFTDKNGIYAGVVTSSSANPNDFYYLESPNTEPFSDVHKMTMVTLYNIPESSEQLMVLNIHGINFVPYEYFVNQINAVAKVIEKHSGPIIFAGDFNTYTDARTKFLEKKLTSLGLVHADIKGHEYQGLLILDHLFYRGFEITKTEVLHHIKTSDHKPLYFELTLKNKYLRN